MKSGSRFERYRLVLADALAWGACILLSETLHLCLRDRLFVRNLATAIPTVLAVYASVFLVIGAVGATIFRSRARAALFTSAVLYSVVSLKMFAISAPLLTAPPIAVAFAACSVALFAALAFAVRRQYLADWAPLWFVVVYYNTCQVLSADWLERGGSVMKFLLASETFVAALVGAAAFTTVVILARRHTLARWATCGLPAVLGGGLTVLIVVLTLSGRAAGPQSAAAARADAPDVYVVSIDALRLDILDAHVGQHPGALRELLRTSTRFDNVVVDGISTLMVLANNTFAGSTARVCSDSLPAELATRGYATAMLLGRSGMRIAGAECYQRYYTGAGKHLKRHFTLFALGARFLGSEPRPLRLRMVPSRELVDELERLLAANSERQVFAYLHLLDLHAPYVPRGRERDLAYADDVRRYMQTCYVRACDLSRPENRQLTDRMRSAYTSSLEEVDAHVARIVDLARKRGRPYVLILTNDHGELFGEGDGFAHGGGFVPELSHAVFFVHESRNPVTARRCELLLSSQALRGTIERALGLPAAIPDQKQVRVVAPPLGTATFDRTAGTLRYQLEPEVMQHAGTWRNVHRSIAGVSPYPFATCN